MRTAISTPKAPAAIGPYSQAIRAGDTLWLSGQIPLDPETMQLVGSNAAEQAEQCLRNLAAVLEAAGGSFENMVRCTIFLKDMGDFGAVNEVYARYMPTPPPARACVEVARLPKDVLVEIDGFAHLGD